MKKQLVAMAQIAAKFEADGNVKAGALITQAMQKIAYGDGTDEPWYADKDIDWDAPQPGYNTEGEKYIIDQPADEENGMPEYKLTRNDVVKMLIEEGFMDPGDDEGETDEQLADSYYSLIGGEGHETDSSENWLRGADNRF